MANDALIRRDLLLGAAASLAAGPALAAAEPAAIVWTFDRLDGVGGEVTMSRARRP